MSCISCSRRVNSWPPLCLLHATCAFVDLLHTLPSLALPAICRALPYFLVTSLEATAGLRSCLLPFSGCFLNVPRTDFEPREPAVQAPSAICSVDLYSGIWRAITKSHSIHQNFYNTMDWLEKGGTKSRQLWQTLLHASLRCTSRNDGLVINVCYFSAATYSCFPGKNLSRACCFFVFKPLNSRSVLV